MNWFRWRRVRQAVQVVSLALYVTLLFAALQRRVAFPLADLFFRLDPLAASLAMLAARAWIPRLALALVIVGLTLLLGRVWCGWLCPLGTLLDWVRFPAARRRASALSRRWKEVKHVLLLTTVALALFGSLSLLIFDPITLLTRTMTTAVLPAFNHSVTAVERTLYSVPFLRPAVDAVERVIRGPVLPVDPPAFSQNAAIALVFAGVLALNALADRFWCRNLCPLGALLGWLSKVSLLRPVVGDACSRCGHCDTVCPVDAIETRREYEIVPSECTVCLDCLAGCPQQGAGFRWHWRPDRIRDADPTRRQALTALGVSAAGIALLRTGHRARQPDPRLIRPPGVTDEGTFLSRCLRCSQCMKVCPTSGLQPTLLEAGPEGLWTPQLVPRLGHCDYSCNACGQICPAAAIPSLNLEQKRQAVIGVAVVDRDRCLPWAHGIPCIVCEEMCPIPDKAIRLEEVTVTDDQGQPALVQQPHLLEDLCIGCGICEAQCPVAGQAAIEIYRG
ncbi:MAG: 4Fe-4S binding protein [Anaerolineae bacterium]|jgi:polyferredoxin